MTTIKHDPTVAELRYYLPPECAGQIVDVSYAIDAELERIVQRTFDKSDRSVRYMVADLEDLIGEFEPWNREPGVDGDWYEVTPANDESEVAS